jgi:hypothetical protein
MRLSGARWWHPAVAVGAVLLAAAPPPVRACGTCAAPDLALAPPVTTCQLQSGTTTAACPSVRLAVDLLAGANYVFSLCPSRCVGAGAAFDARLRIFGPQCVVAAQDDSACGTGAELVFGPAVSGVHVVEVSGANLSEVGDWTLATLEVCREGSCADPNGVLPAPVTDCRLRAGNLECGILRTYSVPLQRASTYTFTLCDATCPGASADFDAKVELWSPSGVRVASSTAACGDDGEVVYGTHPTFGAGIYCLKVISEAASGSAFQVGASVECQPPSSIAIEPDLASTDATGCGRLQSFHVSSGGTGTFTVDWTVAPPPGGSAMPSAGRATGDAAPVTFASRLDGPGTYTVFATISNACGTQSATLAYELADLRGPDLSCDLQEVACRRRAQLVPFSADAAPRPLAARARAVELPASIDLRTAGVLPAGGRHAVTRRPGAAAPDALTCPLPCTRGTLEADSAFYEVFVDCADGSFTARTGPSHPVTLSSGRKQNVIFGGDRGSPGSSDVAFHVHDTVTTYVDPPAGRACIFDPPDTPGEPDSIGLEVDWNVAPSAGRDLLLREEIVAFGSDAGSSGIRLTLGVTNLATSTLPVTVGLRWQVDHQNASDDGPLFAVVDCDPFDAAADLAVERELPDSDVGDFYRIRNNAGAPQFSNFTSTTGIAGFPDTGRPDRVIYGDWQRLSSAPWDYIARDGDPRPDGDSATLLYFGWLPEDAITLAPGEAATRSVVIFTSAGSQDCGGFQPGDGADAVLALCPGRCAELSVAAVDGCSAATVVLESSSPGAPPCLGSPCALEFPDEGTFTYTWRAEDDQGNSTTCRSTVVVADGAACNRPPTCVAGGPHVSGCRDTDLLGVQADDPDGDALTFAWTVDRPDVFVVPDAGAVPGGNGARSLPPTVAMLAPGTDPCGVVATLMLTVADGRGGMSSCTATVTFDDREAPALQGVPADVVAECDAVPAPAAVTASDGCDALPALALDERRVDGDCPGRWVLERTWSARDRCGNTSAATQVVTVVDTTPPRVEPSGADAYSLWPPNHEMRCFTLAHFAPALSDACSEPVTWRFAGCPSDQPDDAPEDGVPGNGDGSTVGDCVVAPDGEGICVRAERLGGGPTAEGGRRYEVLCVATDACGNASAAVGVARIHVPHSRRR